MYLEVRVDIDKKFRKLEDVGWLDILEKYLICYFIKFCRFS